MQPRIKIKNIKKVGGAETPSTFNDINGKSNHTAYAEKLHGFGSYAGSSLYSVDKEAYDLDVKRNDVIRNKYTTEEELQKQRAKNQTVAEQFFNFLEQAVLGEVVLGSAKGLIDIADVVYNGIAEIGAAIKGEERENDYTNPISLFLENLKEQNKERFAIHQANPGKAFDVGDSGWWFNGLTTVATTASLLIPTMVTSKGLSLLGKSMKMARLRKAGASNAAIARMVDAPSRISTNLAKAFGSTTPYRSGQMLDLAGAIGFNAVTQRTIENWQEAREVYKSTYDEALDRYKNLTESQKATFFANNPDLLNKTDEQIAEYIASSSASKTFWNDYAMLLMDIPQFAGISAMWRGLRNKAITGNLDLVNRNLTKRLAAGSVTAGVAGKSLTEATELGKAILSGNGDDLIKNNFINRIKTSFRRPLTAFGALELGEGIEEGYQGIQIEKGKEVADLIFSPNTPTRTIESYLSDPQIWDQAFWGVIGGIGFKAVGRGLGNLERKIKDKANKDSMSEQDYAKSRLTDEKIRELELLGRYNTLQELSTNLEILNQNKNPYKRTEDGKDYATVTEEEADAIRSTIVQDFITKLTLDAVDAGNYELLVEFVSAPEFTKYLKDAGVYDSLTAKLNSTLLDKMAVIEDRYRRYLSQSLEYSSNENPWVANLIARLATRKSLTVDDINAQLGDIEKDLDVAAEYLNASEIEYYSKVVDDIKQNYIKITEAYQNGRITRQAYDAYIDDFKDELKTLHESSTVHIGFDSKYSNILALADGRDFNVGDTINEFLQAYNDTKQKHPELYKKTAENTPNKEQQELLKKKLNLTYLAAKHKASIPKTDKEFKKVYDEFERHIVETAKKKYENAKELVKKYIQEADNVDVAMDNIMKNENLEKEVSDALDLLKIGYDKTADLWQDLMADAVITSYARQAAQQKEQQTVVNGQQVQDPNVAKEATEIINAAKAAENGATPPPPVTQPTPQPIPSTGGGQQAAPSPQTPQTTPEPQAPSTPELAPTPEKKVRDDVPVPKIDPVGLIANKVNSYILKNIKGDIGVYISDIIENESINRDTYNQLFALLKDYVSNEIASVDEQTLAKGINHGIGLFLQLKISALQRANKDSTKEFKIAQLLLDKNNLASEFGVINILPVEERHNYIFEALYNYLSNTGQPIEDKTVINLTGLFKTIIEMNPDVTYYQLLDVYKVLDPYINKGITSTIDGKTVTIIFDTASKALYNKGFDTFLIAGVNSEKFTDKVNVQGLRMALPDKKNREAAEKIIEKIRSGKIKNPKIRLESNAGSFEGTLSIMYTNEKGERTELGRIPRVEKITDEKGVSYIKNIHSTGLMFVFNDANGEIESNFDDLFDLLQLAQDNRRLGQDHEYIPLLEMIERYETGGTITAQDWQTLMSLDVVRNLYEAGLVRERVDENSRTFDVVNGGIVLEFNGFKDYKPNEGTDSEKATKIIKYLANVPKTREGLLDLNNIWNHYAQYRQYVYDNYTEVYTAQESLAKGEFVDISLTAADESLYQVGTEAMPVKNIVGDRYDEFPIFRVNEFGQGITEDGQTVKSSPIFAGKIGIVFERGNTPFTSIVENRRVIDTTSTIVDDLRKELKTIISGLLNKEEGYSFEEVAEKLTKLLSGNVKFKLFSRIVVSNNQGIITVKPYVDLTETDNPNDVDKLLIINKYGSDADRVAAQKPGAKIVEKPYIGTKKAGENYQFHRTYDEAKADAIVDSILEHIKFNLSDITFSASEITKANNPYFYKEDGKLIVDIGGTKREYSSYAELLYREDAISSNVTFSEVGAALAVPDSRSQGIPIAITKRKVDKQLSVKSKRNLTQLIEAARKRKDRKMTTLELLEAVGLEGLESLLFTGEWYEVGTTPYDLVDNSISVMTKAQIEKRPGAFFMYDADTDTTYINPNKFKNISIDTNVKLEVIRGLLHERLHKLFAQAEEGHPLRRAQIVKELLDTYRLFRNRLANETNNPLAKPINEQFKAFLDKYTLVNDSLYIDGKPAKEVDTLLFVEEWLVESFTQPAIMQFNNEKEVTTANVENIKEENKTIFQKIIDCVIKLFNIISKTLKTNRIKIKNNTILAKQYLLLSKEITAIQNEETVTTEEEKTGEETKGDSNLSPVEGMAPNEPNPPQSKEPDATPPSEPAPAEPATKPKRTFEKRKKNFDLTDEVESAYPMITYDVETKEDALIESSTHAPIVNPFGVITINNMNEFADLFSEADKLKIATMIENGEVNYLCQ